MWKALCLGLCLVISGCGSSIDEYQSATPKIDIFRYFDGQSRAWGMMQDFSGKQIRRFEVTIRGEVLGDTLTLHEQFAWDDGEKQTRVWQIRRLQDGSYVGTANDIIGRAIGHTAGNAFNWRYQMEVKTDSSSYRLNFDDWIWQQDERHLLNVTSLKKFGIEVARVTIFFNKEADDVK
ncbi:DUF3833 domain-containing protein [Erwiniaceae bacterium BAC15a-03b]|uniref:DUF3833 domain-containing protein n=1 Tax=Winslowiella arboricola TaxID=2978220 RepID=A0A9J6Q312_9GAMM|nr:DUF3833 domain-containing protein [Winslowiella arboricola]MCU5772917.1 DUF3833 domain-containing protein [Winslowiella arboricola]MCU5780655.1 DUF3833 domain-containing protein [Winslowiella arboricola]